MKNYLTSFSLLIALLVSCSDEPTDSYYYGSGVYVINEGFFNQSNGSVSYYNPATGVLLKNIFEIANERPAGDVIQSLGISGDTIAYMIVNGLSKVEVVRLSDFKTIAPSLAIDYPRYFIQSGSSKGYISSGAGSGNIMVVDLTNHEITDTIPVGSGPETMASINDMAYICNSGGFYKDSTISVINTITDQVTDTIYTEMCPSAIASDNDGNLWVYCRGSAEYNDSYTQILRETDAVIQKIDPVSGEILWSGTVGTAGDFTTMFPKLAAGAGRDKLYYLKPDGMYVINVSTPVISTEAVIPGNFYGIFIHPESSDIYLFEASLAGNGKMRIFNSSFEEVADYEVGIMPNGAVGVR